MEEKETVVEAQEGQPEMAETSYTRSTDCDHVMVLESKDVAVCSKGCGHGCMFNPETQDIRDGKIIEKRNTE